MYIPSKRVSNDFTAFYKCGSGGGSSSSGSGSSSGNSQVTVSSQDTSGNTISGYYTVLMQNGATVNTGFTPTTFATTSGQTYTVEVQDYGSYHFDHWKDNGSQNRDRTFTATSSAQSFVAVYSTSTTNNPPPSSGSSIADIMTFDQNGNEIRGYYTSLWQNGNQIDSCFSPCAFYLSNGQTYQIAVADYGSCTFSHWNAGGSPSDRFDTIQGFSSTTIKYYATYNCT